MQVYVFTYRWWRFMEGLFHRITESWTDAAKAPEGSYLYFQGQWYQRRRTKSSGAAVMNISQFEHQVPKEIRTTLLLLK